jgi:flagellar hook-length control protein FliK
LDQLPQASKPTNSSLPLPASSSSAKSEAHQGGRHEAGPTNPTELTRSAESTGNATSHPSDAPLQSGLSKEPGKESVGDASASKADSGETGNFSTGTVQSSKATSKGDSGNSEKGSSSGNDHDSWAAASSSATATAAAGAGLSGGDTQDIFAKPTANSLPSTPLGAPAGMPLSSMISPDGAGAVPAPKASPSVLTHPSAAADQAELPSDSAAAYPNNQLNSAKMVERLGQAELRVGLQAGEFGRVDIRTSMLHNQFTTHISVERGELGKVLASELPGLQSRLSEQRFPAGSITVEQQSTGGSAAFGQGSRQNQTNSGNKSSYNLERDPVATAANLTEATASTGRLDVHI